MIAAVENDEATNKEAEIRQAEARIRELEIKLARVQKDRAVFAVKSRLLGEELDRYRNREDREHSLVEDLLERQRELNVMLNRSNILLARAQDATAMLSIEFGELARALPETVSPEGDTHAQAANVGDRVQKINDLFRKTGQLAEELKETLHNNAEAQRRAAAPAGSSASTPVPPPQAAPSATPAQESASAVPQEPAPQEDEAEVIEIDKIRESAPSVFESWAARSKSAGDAPEDEIIREIASEQERADIEAALGQQGLWQKLRGRFNK
ncbi:MAG: hypothetical protein IT209_12090 [Armatimonadetes bacterium]|nr:hypothetical protein [Armatimonadota bacterium]